MNHNEDFIEEAEEMTPPKPAGMDTQRKIMLGLAAALVLVALGMYGWKVAAVSAVESRLAEVESRLADERGQLIEQARRLDAAQVEDALRRFSVPLAWVIRREAIAGNLDQIDQYFTDLVRLQGFQSALLAQTDGKVLVASDRKKLAEAFSAIYPAEYLQAAEIRVDRAASGNLRAIIPILGLNQHLGTLVLEFTPPAYSLP